VGHVILPQKHRVTWLEGIMPAVRTECGIGMLLPQTYYTTESGAESLSRERFPKVH